MEEENEPTPGSRRSSSRNGQNNAVETEGKPTRLQRYFTQRKSTDEGEFENVEPRRMSKGRKSTADASQYPSSLRRASVQSTKIERHESIDEEESAEWEKIMPRRSASERHQNYLKDDRASEEEQVLPLKRHEEGDDLTESQREEEEKYSTELNIEEEEQPKQEEEIQLPFLKPDRRFPHVNQTQTCFKKCIRLLGEDEAGCERFKRRFTSYCPNEWVAKWNEQLEENRFSVRLPPSKKKTDSAEKLPDVEEYAKD